MNLTKDYNEQQLEQIIKDHIVKEFMYNKSDVLLSNDLPLIKEGIIDSMGIFQLINFIEQQFGFTLNPEEVSRKNFQTINAIKSFVITKLQ
ncbi:MAG: acyl carrier protein [Symploca sp. SIO2E6]|nr:acyl carrier protein [Symploca sp. SIO2E6]